MKTTFGVARFENLIITDSGYNQIIVGSSDGLVSATTQQFWVKKLKSMSYTVSETSPSMNFPFFVNIILLSDDSTLYTKNCIVTIIGNGLKGTTTKNTDTGNADFRIYYTIPGTYSIIAYCESLSIVINIKINSNNIRTKNFIPVILN